MKNVHLLLEIVEGYANYHMQINAYIFLILLYNSGGVDIFKASKICANYHVCMINNIGAEVAKIISVLTRGIYQRGVSVPYINSAALARH